LQPAQQVQAVQRDHRGPQQQSGDAQARRHLAMHVQQRVGAHPERQSRERGALGAVAFDARERPDVGFAAAARVRQDVQHRAGT
jgi:hypothetical protein